MPALQVFGHGRQSTAESDANLATGANILYHCCQQIQGMFLMPALR